jgi:hypothetical protein
MNLISTSDQVRQNIIQELNRMGYYETDDKTIKELTYLLAVMQIQIENADNHWF